MLRLLPIHEKVNLAWAGVACVLASVGCTGPWSPRGSAEPLAVSRTAGDSLPALPLASEQPATPLADSATASSAAPVTVLSTEQEISLNNLVGEIRRTMRLDAAAEHQLRSDLRAARADEWPAVVKQFRSALAYKQELLARDAQHDTSLHTAAHRPQFPPAPTPAQRTNEVERALDQLQAAVVHDESIRLASHTAATPTARLSEPLQVRGTTVVNRAIAEPATVEQASHTETDVVDADEELANAIAALEQEAQALPGSTAELQDHLRLRMLMLMAGRENDSLAPIPGASPTEQDYWSKQLFALATYLDAERVPDTRQRATGALIHFDAARAKLAELATLEVRNLVFVDSVDGYGLYEPHKDAKFKPGDQVTLYAEVENYRSESTKDGYRTTLATSYEVVDLEGRRVDGAQFPEVEDLCRNQRRDFHMQYGVALPTRIYAGQYELRLIITDQLSHKIGQASVRFEIVE